jgi:class 3 adenylate cyclase/tetratricopeptide (TPR) repeat protein
MTCPACSTENKADRKFCSRCGTPLAHICAACGAANDPGDSFCGECGVALAPESNEAVAQATAASTERRRVSVLFADLVGFTASSENRDPEEVREFLTRYFDEAQRVIERYGGTVEKFIGDAVMAVWGTPVAQEDDAERTVRAALELVAAVPELDESLQARAGVLTGQAAVTVGAVGQSMVAGDLVNAASRVQTRAAPGTVLVGESTKRASEAAIAYKDAGTHELRGRDEGLRLWQALRITATRGGALKPTGLEPPFVGRARELRLVQELFNTCIEERTAHLVSVIAGAGNGKSRVAWEFQKYIDGITAVIRVHRGRCLAYGEGVTYWALAEMVRMRAGIVEGEDSDAARAKLHLAVEAHVPDPDEQAWVEPRLAHLLGLEERQVHERKDLFAGWRLFFERMSEQFPVLLVFDDMQWADASLLEFVDYLLEWSRSYPIFILTLARPELVERNPQWGAGKRNFTSISLEPLSEDAMTELLGGLVPGLPEELRHQILERAEGVPLYAVETVRMLLDRGLLEREGNIYRPTGTIEALDVPETLHALIAARLDGLKLEERRILQDASVLGKTFTKQALAAVSGEREPSLDGLLTALVRKELLTIHTDPRSPERGQYGFLQDLFKHVAYETLGRRERKVRHLSAAAFLEERFGAGEHEVVEVLAAHYVGAFEAAPDDDDDATEIKTKAREMLARAGDRAASLAASGEAQRYFAQAAELTEEPRAEAELRERAGEMAASAARHEEAQVQYERAIELLEGEGDIHPAARVLARLAWVEWQRGQLEQAIERMEGAFAVLSADEPDADFAVLTAELGRLHFFSGNRERSSELLELAVGLGESFLLPEVLAQALNTYGLIATWGGRLEMGLALTGHSLKLALEHDLPTPALRAYNNLGDSLGSRDRYDEALAYHDSGIALARRVGNRQWEWQLLIESTYPLALTGRWDEAMERVRDVPDPQLGALSIPPVFLVVIEAARGNIVDIQRFLSLLPSIESSRDVQIRAILASIHAVALRAEGRGADALAAGEEAFDGRPVLSTSHQAVKLGFVEAVEAAFGLGKLDKVEQLVATVEALRPGEIAPFVRAQTLRFRARLAAAQDSHDGVEPGFKQAESIFREFGIPFWLAVTQLEHGEWLLDQGRSEDARSLLDEAHTIFERLQAPPWLERAEQVMDGANQPTRDTAAHV